MIRSMTGYGSGTATGEEGVVAVETRSVNSRGLKVVVKGPQGSEAWELELRELIERYAKRGRVDVFIRVEETPGSGGRHFDAARVQELLDAAARLRDDFDVGGEIDVGFLLGAGGVLREGTPDERFQPEYRTVATAVEEALGELVAMRAREGERLAADLRERLDGLRRAVDGAEEVAPRRLERERSRIQAAVAELAEKGLDEERLAREIALIADRWDVGEEIVRARSHLEAFEEFLGAPNEEPVGKRLAFLVQELQREINTLGAKANDSEISRLVVEAKNEIERLREQVENVE
ncbi:MAG: YicC family protein [Gemmatimonadetes bacterium]|nr:YicC family protein [Gemmatimonadota bacterium]